MFVIVSLVVIILFSLMKECFSSNSDAYAEIRINTENKIVSKLSELGDIKYLVFLNENSAYSSTSHLAIVDDCMKIKVGNLERIVKIKDILKFEIRYEIEEQNKMRFVSMMPTYDKKVQINSIQIILYLDGLNDIILNLNPQTVSDYKIKKLQLMIEKYKDQVNG